MCRSRTCLNGGLVVFAHGYVGPDEPLQIPDYEIDGTTLPALVNQLGFVYATSSYPENGLAIQEGIADLVDLTTLVMGTTGLPGPVYLTGASEGGAVTALAVERHSNVFSGGLALCGPVGSFRRQIDYYGDVRVVFDYFFPRVLPGTAVDPDPTGEVRANWGLYTSRILLALQANPNATAQFLKVLRMPYDPNDPTTVGEAVVGTLWYNVFATYDAVDKLGGQPFDNRWRFYTGSSNDFRLNLRVKRYSADGDARLRSRRATRRPVRSTFPSSPPTPPGTRSSPTGTSCTTAGRRLRAGSGRMHTNLPVFRYGHCEFTATEATTAFAILVGKVNAQQ